MAILNMYRTVIMERVNLFPVNVGYGSPSYQGNFCESKDSNSNDTKYVEERASVANSAQCSDYDFQDKPSVVRMSNVVSSRGSDVHGR